MRGYFTTRIYKSTPIKGSDQKFVLHTIYYFNIQANQIVRDQKLRDDKILHTTIIIDEKFSLLSRNKPKV